MKSVAQALLAVISLLLFAIGYYREKPLFILIGGITAIAFVFWIILDNNNYENGNKSNTNEGS